MRTFTEPRLNPGLYGKNNPPANLEVAHRRLQSVNAEMGDIEAQLAYTDPSLYPNAERFNDWKRRATRAVGVYRAEKDFLERWIGKEETKNLPANVIQAQREAAVHALERFVDEKVRYFSSKFQPRYGANTPDPTHQQAVDRLAELNAIWSECAGAFLEIKSRGNIARVSDKQMERLRKPLGTVNHSLQTEIAFLKDVLSTSPHLRQRFDKIGFLLSVLERAKVVGFVLTPDEQASLKVLLDDREAAFERIRQQQQIRQKAAS